MFSALEIALLAELFSPEEIDDMNTELHLETEDVQLDMRVQIAEEFHNRLAKVVKETAEYKYS